MKSPIGVIVKVEWDHVCKDFSTLPCMCLIHISSIVSVYYCPVAPLISMCPVSSWSALTLADA